MFVVLTCCLNGFSSIKETRLKRDGGRKIEKIKALTTESIPIRYGKTNYI